MKKPEELLEGEDYQGTLENRDGDEDASKSEEESEMLLEEFIKLGHIQWLVEQISQIDHAQNSQYGKDAQRNTCSMPNTL